MRKTLPAKCVHCAAREPLDTDGFCVDYNACVDRKPLAGSTRDGQRLHVWEPGTGPLVTKTGKVLTDDDIQALADEAERGYDVTDTLRRQRPRRRPLLDPPTDDDDGPVS